MSTHAPYSMVGEMRANFSVPLWKRYLRVAKHSQPGRLKKAVMGFVLAVEMQLGAMYA